jgi:Na+-translocating ferredoxin:NAD+ oxidoreductase RnfG subunit
MERLDLLAKEIESGFQARMAFGPAGVVIEVSMMAFGKDGDAVDMRPLHHAGELAGVKFRAHVADPGTGMKIQVNLSERKRKFIGHGSDSCAKVSRDENTRFSRKCNRLQYGKGNFRFCYIRART